MSFSATLRLLSSSLVVAVSGGFKLYVAFLLLGTQPNLSLCFAFSLLVYSIYTLDRVLKSKEDAVNRAKIENAKKLPVVLLVCIAVSASALILIKEKISLLVVLFPLITGFMYSRGLKIGSISLKLKRGLGVKNFVTAFTWAATLAAFIYPWAESFSLLMLISLFFFLKSFINTVIYDYKDMKGDAMAGLVTLPIYFGEVKTRVLLQALHVILHLSIATLVLLNFISFEPVVLIYSATVGFVYVLLYTTSRDSSVRDVAVDGEWIFAVLLRNLAVQLSRSGFHSI